MQAITKYSLILRCLVPVLSVLLASCAPVGPDFVKPEPEVADGWSQPVGEGLESEPADLVEWWLVFNDPVLNALVEDSLKGNNGLEVAGLRVLEARAQLGIATGLQYPQSQAAFGEATWVSPPESSGVNSNYWNFGLGASAAWEIDFWGRFRRGIESADAAFLASIAAYDQARILLASAVVSNYVLIRVLEEQLRIAHENLRIQKRSYDIAGVLFRNGADSELDMQQANTLLLSTESTIPSLETSARKARNALSTLLGQPPGSVTERLTQNNGIPVLPGNIAIGFPADMLRRRPDVRQAEFLAMAQNALIGMAKADLYPSFSLVGSIGLTSGGPGDLSFGDLFGADALGLSIGPSFVWPFLNYDRIKNNVRVQDVRLQQALVHYSETVLQASREAEDAIASYIGANEQIKILEKTVISAERSNELSTLRYKEGFSDYQRVLDAQKALFTQQQRYITAQGDSVTSLVILYKALGGGWDDSGALPWINPETLEVMRERTDWGDMIEIDLSNVDDTQLQN